MDEFPGGRAQAAKRADRRLHVQALGPLRVHTDGRELSLGSPRQRAVFAILALTQGTPVSRDDLIDQLWGDEPPPTAVGNLHTYVSGLRRALGGHSDLLTRSSSGYLLRLDAEEVDALRVKRLADHGRIRQRASDPEGALTALEEALACWRPGPALSGLPGPFAAAHRGWAAGLKLRLALDRAQLLLELHRPEHAADGLVDLIDAHPFDERLYTLLVTALHRSGRSADALAEYRTIQDRLADELGVAPSAELRAAHDAIRPGGGGPPRPARPAARMVRPAQLARGIGRFVGRTGEIREIIAAAQSGAPYPEVVLAVGVGGIGKTSLAVHCGHLLSAQFPDGQLFLDLRGFDPQQSPLSPADALHYLLTSLGVRDVPVEPVQRAALWRSVVRGRRLLIVLDNASSADQIIDLMPGEGPSLVLVTSRNRLGGLSVRYGVRRLTLAPLAMDESLELLGEAISADTIAAALSDAKRLAELCDHLPLALRIAGEQATARRSGLGQLVAELEDAQLRLDMLQIPDDRLCSVRVVLSLSYDRLDAAAARAFRLFGAFPGPSVTAESAAALLDVPVVEAAAALARLAAQHLVNGVEGRYRMHDLTALYAGEVARSGETRESWNAALERVAQWYVQTIFPEYRRLAARVPFEMAPGPVPSPRFADQAQALDWSATEWENIGPLIGAAHDAGLHRYAWQLAYLCFEYFYAAGQPRQWAETVGVGIRSAEALGDRRAQAVLLNHLSVARSRTGDNAAAISHLRRALGLIDSPEDDRWRTSLLGNLASTLREARDYVGALPFAAQALRLAREGGLDYYEAGCLDVLCQLHTELGDFTESLRHGTEGLLAARRCGDRLLEANLLINLGITETGLGRAGEGHERFAYAVTISRDTGDRYHEALALFGLARLRRAQAPQGRWEEPAVRALDLLQELGAEETADVAAFLERDEVSAAGGRALASAPEGPRLLRDGTATSRS